MIYAAFGITMLGIVITALIVRAELKRFRELDGDARKSGETDLEGESR